MLFIALLCNFLIHFAKVTEGRIAEIGMNATQLIAYRGYPYEIHETTTEDGYILQMQRIPHGRNDNQTQRNKPAVLFVAGFECSSLNFLIYNPDMNMGLPYILADLGYDIWMGNTRGQLYSRKHVKLDAEKDKAEFWNFSIHEFGYYDLPSMIDYILKQTGQNKLFYIAHSVGTTDFFIMASTRPEYNDKIRLSISLAPIVFMGNVKDPGFQIGGFFVWPLQVAKNVLHLYQFLPLEKLISVALTGLCSNYAITQGLCKTAILVLSGWDSQQLNTTMLPLIASIEPGGASVKELLHLLQLVHSGKFQNYDYGLVGNKRHYSSFRPPQYDLKKVTAPSAIYHGANDQLSSMKDNKLLVKALPNLARDYLVPFKYWNHGDFLWAIDIKEYMYNDIIQLMKKY